MSTDPSHRRASRLRISDWLPEREIFLRSGGQVRFVRIGTRAQAVAVAVVGVALLLWAAVTVVMLARHGSVAIQQAELSHERAVVDRRAARLDSYRRSAAGIAQQLEERQRLIEDLVKTRLGPVAPQSAQPAPASKGQKTSAAIPTADDLRALEQRQDAFARQLAATFDARSTQAEATLRGLGLNPQAMLADARRAEGGPLEAWSGDDVGDKDLMTAALRALATSVERLGVLEDTLITLPSDLPTHAQMVTSSFGVRTDPFTGAPAFHPGLDFRGSYGQPIFAAAGGKVSFVGDRNGYGHVVEIDHGHGIMTRYAHLSGFAAHVGEVVTRGEPIALMGSTGRSTGTHLHFEVRLDNKPLDPRRFLAHRQDPFDVQQQVASQGPVDGHRG